MNRKIAGALVALSVVAGGVVGFVIQRSQDQPAAASPVSTSPAPTASASATAGDIAVEDAVLVKAGNGGATFVATVTGPDGEDVRNVSAASGDRRLDVGHGFGELGGSDPLGSDPVSLGTISAGAGGYVVHGVDVGDEVAVTVSFAEAPSVTLDVPVVAGQAGDDVVLFEGPPPTITSGTIGLFEGDDRAPIGFTVVSENGERDEVAIDRITASGPDGAPLDLEHQTATGGPSGVIALPKPMEVPLVPPQDGDMDYFDATRLKVGDVVTVRFPFASGVTVAEFRVVAG